jgi:hypothetical protein
VTEISLARNREAYQVKNVGFTKKTDYVPFCDERFRHIVFKASKLRDIGEKKAKDACFMTHKSVLRNKSFFESKSSFA